MKIITAWKIKVLKLEGDNMPYSARKRDEMKWAVPKALGQKHKTCIKYH